MFQKDLLLKWTLKVSIPNNGQRHSNNYSAVPDELFECVSPFCGVAVYMLSKPICLPYFVEYIPKELFKNCTSRGFAVNIWNNSLEKPKDSRLFKKKWQ